MGIQAANIETHGYQSGILMDINGTLGAYWLKYTQMNGFINNQRDMNMGF
jgi:hypothetical protein